MTGRHTEKPSSRMAFLFTPAPVGPSWGPLLPKFPFDITLPQLCIEPLVRIALPGVGLFLPVERLMPCWVSGEARRHSRRVSRIAPVFPAVACAVLGIRGRGQRLNQRLGSNSISSYVPLIDVAFGSVFSFCLPVCPPDVPGRAPGNRSSTRQSARSVAP